MLQIINCLCKSSNLSKKSDFENLINNDETLLNNLFYYKHPKTGDCFIHYLVRSGNLNLLKFIYSNYSSVYPNNYFEFSNNDGKTALHEVKNFAIFTRYDCNKIVLKQKACQFSHYEMVVYLIENLNLNINKLRKGDW